MLKVSGYQYVRGMSKGGESKKKKDQVLHPVQEPSTPSSNLGSCTRMPPEIYFIFRLGQIFGFMPFSIRDRRLVFKW